MASYTFIYTNLLPSFLRFNLNRAASKHSSTFDNLITDAVFSSSHIQQSIKKIWGAWSGLLAEFLLIL